MSWMRVKMSPDEEDGHYEKFQEAFFDAFAAAGAPKEAAMFVTANVAEEGYFYFSPAAAALFKAVIEKRESRPCSTPTRGSVTLLVGQGDPMDLLD